ncbi:MFS transporter [Streptomyces kunmingensis]|uniref:MFS transporter n=1 Tax=Streptomyces kunmingensis TaxID=68225 RepID=A0ABU6C1V1_9ACTN|nr:MFS transporter [Streptomyces kunmingensis]MEB3958687.1 MFS transporter [Streptomyces kunmingensis]
MSEFAGAQAPSATDPRKLTSGPFVRLWTAYTVNVAGDEFYTLAVPLIAYQAGASAGSMSLLYACSLLPQVVMGVLGGVVADRAERVKILRISYLCSALTLLTACAIFGLTGVHLAGLAATAVLLGATAPVAAAAFDSSISLYVEPAGLSRANAMTEASRTVCVVAGPAAAGVLLGHTAPQYALLVNALSFIGAFLVLHSVRTRARSAATLGKALPDGFGTALKAGLRHLLKGRGSLRIGVALSTVINLVFGAYEPLVVYRLRDQVHASSSTVGLVMACAGAVSLAVALLLSWKAPSRSFMSVMGVSTAAQGLSVAVVALSDSVVLITCAQAAFVSAMLVYTVYWRAMRQANVPSAFLGRVSGACRAIAFGGSFLGSVVSYFLLNGILAVDIALLAAGVMVLALGILLTAWTAVGRKTTAM